MIYNKGKVCQIVCMFEIIKFEQLFIKGNLVVESLICLKTYYMNKYDNQYLNQHFNLIH